ncbi:bacillithiol biosynthesis cysteine-adding enzyme BshC [Ichthyobacterium seriolicida]|uniref:Putative cysteine ligase BshC n=1 Tax=Ichthyobacterium seriolicida TaxID=242600 RepID=A0A1J1E3A9_9FLAO|nr:bacillithiol biosynthesis cysteine-adding enzyme BshC [Ichthyobacterium seriolicida]BAV94524.1 hypothetical protein JBKA6_0511 [Ichthyobacterium seriolicida]
MFSVEVSDIPGISPLILDYVNQDKNISGLYENYPSVKNVKRQIEYRKNHPVNRALLAEVFTHQYKNTEISSLTKANINSIKDENTFTITTGHQINLFTGPVFFIYKIMDAVLLAKHLKEIYPKYNFVPVYWMATEDHDFEEINHFNFRGSTFKWNTTQTGAVGRFDTWELKEQLEEILNTALPTKVFDVFKEAYFTHKNLSQATRYLINNLFGEYGLLILDPDQKQLKKQMISYFKRELLGQVTYKNVNQTIDDMPKKYRVVVNPRDINLFYLKDDIRERIVYEGDSYKVLNTDIEFSEGEIIKELESNPERFSPNVLMRPLYQEVILPNLCYMGGATEISYWLQLKNNFNYFEIPFPILKVRNSVLVFTKKQYHKMKKLNICDRDIFLTSREIINASLDIDNHHVSKVLSDQVSKLRDIFCTLKEESKKTNITFYQAVLAQEAKQLKGLKKLERRLYRAERKVNHSLVERIENLKEELFPNNGLQERCSNFFELYEDSCVFLSDIEKNINPMDFKYFALISDI